MTQGRMVDTVLLVVGLLLVGRCIWSAARPAATQRLTAWWAEAAGKVNTLMGLVCAVIAIGLWTLVLLRQPLANWLLTLVGAAFAFTAGLYWRPPSYQKALDLLILNRTPASLRTLAILVGLVGLFLVGVALKGILGS